MNEKNSLGLNICFKDEKDPINLFREWFEEAKKSEINDANAFSLGTTDKNGFPTVRIILLKDFNKDGFVFYTNLKSSKSIAINENSKISMCFHWKSLLRQVRIVGSATQVTDKEADEYYNSRPYDSRIGAWASNQSSILNKRDDLIESINKYKTKFSEDEKMPRPSHWSGWRLLPTEIEFWLHADNRIHERLKYSKNINGEWDKFLLNP